MLSIVTAEGPGVGVLGNARPSEDRVIVVDNGVIVLDGATNLTPGVPSGGWYADRLAERIGPSLHTRPETELSKILEEAIRDVTAEHGLVTGVSPSCTVAMARWTSDRVDALVLADSPVVAFGDGGPQPLVDSRLRALPKSRHTYHELLLRGVGYGDEVVEALRSGMAATASRYRNSDEGFWVAEADPAAARRAVCASWDRSSLTGMILATDGVACGVDDYQLFDWAGVFELARAQGPQAVLDAVRRAERADPDGQRWPRPKRHDDQALVLVDGL